jgi:hypothetical protein
LLTIVRFTKEESIASQSQVKSSVGRAIRNAILEQYPFLLDKMEYIIPKKSPLIVVKWYFNLTFALLTCFA